MNRHIDPADLAESERRVKIEDVRQYREDRRKPSGYRSGLRYDRLLKVAQIAFCGFSGAILGAAAFFAGYWAGLDTVGPTRCMADVLFPALGLL